MSCLGVLFSLDKEAVDSLKSFTSDEDRLNYLQMEIEEEYFNKYPDKLRELDKSWDAIHRTLTDGKLEWTNGISIESYYPWGRDFVFPTRLHYDTKNS